MPLPPLKEMAQSAYEATKARKMRLLLMTLVIVLTFEGLARKLQIPGTSVPIFFLKDVIVLIMGFRLLRMRRPPAIDFLWLAYLILIVLFLPLIVWTAFHDPILALFGAKEYLLYPIVGFAVFFAFHDSDTEQIVRFFRWVSLLIIPTTIVALIQIRLPPTHWLNLSVGGAELIGFSAGGELRVSSTFSFVAQYGAFLNAELFMLLIALNKTRDLNFLWKAIYLSLIPLFIIGNYITGSRGAVVGCITVTAITGALSLMKFQIRSTFRLAAIVLSLFFIIMAEQYFFPDEFAAYAGREQGHLIGYSSDVQQRTFGALFNWATNISSTPFFGYGLGIMSNGSDTLSDYAAHYRVDLGMWTETDFASTLFEGGFYLILVWYGFRYYVIYQTWRRFLADVHEDLSVPASFCQATVILFGITNTLGIQPPVAIWWWMAVGTSLLIWWKCVEPKRNEEGLIVTQHPPPEKKLRGRSAYAERLHGGK